MPSFALTCCCPILLPFPQLQICREFERFGKPLNVKVGNFFGGMDVKAQRELLKDEDKCPDIVVGTPGRIKQVRPRAGRLKAVAQAGAITLATAVTAAAAPVTNESCTWPLDVLLAAVPLKSPLICPAPGVCCNPCFCVQLVTEKSLGLKQLKFFVIDECDKVLEKSGEQHKDFLLLKGLLQYTLCSHLSAACVLVAWHSGSNGQSFRSDGASVHTSAA